ncbi:MAG: phosphatidate cytidylyltransferase [Bacteroidetes bacterium]|nr:phosphatidate cytidylyltransferase [Bacteroidota bacterium]HET6243972.1 phosphatidate cytidylyltransferase [Bacteroidia bacterium]
MLTRSITGAIFIAVLIGAIIVHPVLFFILFLIITFIGLQEFYSIASKAGFEVQKTTGTLAGLIVFILICSFSLFEVIEFKFLSLALFVPFSLFIVELYRKSKTPLANIAVSLMGIIYVAVPFALLSFLIINTETKFGGIFNSNILLGYFLIIWTNDTGAYLAGRSMGKRKLFERISPKKTWEGAAGGFILALAIAYVLSLFYTELSVRNWLIMAAILAITGNLGDLTESMFKRQVGIKDSGNLLPGHGGILDRFDAILISAPFVWIFLTLIN